MKKNPRHLSLFIVISASIVMAAFLAGSQDRPGRLSPSLEQKLQQLAPGEKLPVIIELDTQAKPSQVVSKMAGASRPAKAQAVVEALKSVAEQSQPPLLEYLRKEEAAGAVERIISYWVFNGVAVTATEPLIRELASRPEVREIRPDVRIPVPSLLSTGKAAPSPPVAEWNINKVRAPEVWALNPAYNGSGTVVGSFDTGVDLGHPDLLPRYRGDNNISWFDPYNEHASPYDANGHGTHTTGIAVGGDASGSAIGVAPGAAWIAAKAWDDAGNGDASSFHEIFQWFLAPGGNPDNAPDVVNNSWAYEEAGCRTEFVSDIEAWRAAGIFPAFGSGNSGPLPGSVASPGAYAVSFAVGSTDSSDAVSDFSSRGPSPCDNGIKPNIAAPGEAILSAVPLGWEYLSGTSMATPHVTGAVAILRSIAPALTVEQLESALASGALDIENPGPDNLSGAGRLDLYVSAQVALHGPGFPVVKLAATDNTATEAGPTSGTLTITRVGNTDADLEVRYTVGGTAISGSDYETIPNSVTIPAGEDSATITVTAIDDTLAENDESVTLTLASDPAYIVSANSSATVTIKSDELLSDLIVSAFSAPAAAAAGQAISLTDTTRNQGKGAADPSLTRFYLSANSTLEPADILLGARQVPVLAAGASNAGSTAVSIPQGQAAGTWYLIAKADGEDAVVESTETNNKSSRTIKIGPDFDITAFSAPTVGAAGQTITVTDTTKNIGAGAAGSSQTRFYLSKNTSLEPADTLIGSRSVPALAAGAASSGSATVTIPQGTATGTWNLIAQADGEGIIAEALETNNAYSRTIAIGPDLDITAMSSPATAAPGQTIAVTDTTKNAGGGPAGASVTQVFFSKNSTIDASDLLAGSRNVPALAAGASSAGSVSFTIPEATATGTWYLLAKADGPGALTETSETNNTYSRTINIGADLDITAMSAPSGAGAGQTIVVTDTTKNIGAAAAGPTVTRIYFSADGSIGASDILVGSRNVPALGAGQSSSGSTNVTIPAGTVPKTWYLIAKADGEGVLAETSETNNTFTLTIYIGPDLTVTAVSAPATAVAGQTISVGDTTKNKGAQAASPTTTDFYLSTNSSLDASDVRIGSRSVPALAGGTSSAGTAAVTIPSGTTAGTWYIIAKADAAGAVAETWETNNTLSKSIKIN
jgi:subtilisin family serine protease/subtilase family serine protease